MRYKLLLFLQLICVFLFAQGQSRFWYFGNGAGIDFSSNPPTTLTNGGMYTVEGCAVQTSNNGNLLFYTNGVTVFNQNHVAMANGTGLLGNASTTQSSIICKLPGSINLYYVFTLAELGNANGLRYSIVDMSLAAGIGSVTTKNVPIYGPCAEKLTAIKHCNGVDYWVVSHEYGTNVFRSYLLTAAGLSTTAVLSSSGFAITSNQQTLGAMKISPNGKKLGMASYNLGSFELFDFDRASGQVSNGIQLQSGNFGYGCEFSPDGTKFYGGAINTGGGQIYQWDLCAGSAGAIVASEYTISTGINQTGALQLGPDGKIYVAQASTNTLAAIANPNQSGAACNFIFNAINLSPRFVILGLPNFPVDFFRVAPAVFSFTVNNLIACRQVSFSPSPAISTGSVIGCSAAGYSLTSINWNFGEPSSGAANTSTLAYPTHVYAANGTYTVQEILNYSCGNADTLYKAVTVASNLPQLTSAITGPTLLCTPSTKVYSTQSTPNLGTYVWGASAGNSFTNASTTATVNLANSGTISLYAYNGCGNSNTLSLNVQVGVNALINIMATKTLVCSGGSTSLTAGGALTFTWQSGFVGNMLNPVPQSTGIYSVVGTHSSGCIISGSIQIVVAPNPTISVGLPSYSICSGQNFSVQAQGASTYSWSNGSVGAILTITPGTTSNFNCIGTDNNSCSDTVSVTVYVFKCTGLFENITTNRFIRCYPSPFENELTIVCDNCELGKIELISIDGQKFFVLDSVFNSAKIDTEALPSGLYFLKTKEQCLKIYKK